MATNWPKQKQIAFLEHLALSSNIAASERVAGVPVGSSYRLRDKSDDFRRSWELALKTGYDRLELAVLERAINGALVKRTTAKDGSTTEEYKHDDRVATTLLNAHRASVAAITARDGGESAKARLAKKLAAMNLRLGGDG